MEPETTTRVPVERLHLDRENPRLVDGPADAADEAIIARLYRSAELDELLQSISANGYLDIEPLVVMAVPVSAPAKRVAEGDEFVVLEGNRRLATLRLLREPELANRIKRLERTRIAVPAIDDARRKTLDEVSVYWVADRKRARAFIGFKHINGPAKWNAYAKARFAATWYRSNGDSLDEIANAIGDRHDTIKRMVSAIYVLEQARERELFDIEERYDRKFNFSHLYTALSRSEYMHYLGLDVGWARHDPKPNQIPPDKLDRLKQVLVWIYGAKPDDKRPVVRSQNPDIKLLGEVLANAEGRHVLETTGRLDDAHVSTEPADSRLTASLLRARSAIREASHAVRAYDGQDQSLFDIAQDVRATAEMVCSSMEKRRRSAAATD